MVGRELSWNADRDRFEHSGCSMQTGTQVRMATKGLYGAGRLLCHTEDFINRALGLHRAS